MMLLAQALRTRHWVKNVLVFVPLVAGHRVDDPQMVGIAALAFLTFCLAASAGYLVNDVVDLKHDRESPSKARRPIASGELPVPIALFLAASLSASALALAWLWLPPLFTFSLAGYVALSVGYSLRLKRIVLVDVLVLAALYSARIIAGGIATGIFVSPWLLSFSLFLFLSLALLKRYTVLQAAGGSLPGLAYVRADRQLLRVFGPVSGYLSALVFVLYINSAAAALLYGSPELLWLIVPLLVYWITRLWLFANRGDVHEDPLVFVTRDAVTYFVGFLAAGILVISTVTVGR
jgi:4-hydroxybenzoate polyprenyltransferase